MIKVFAILGVICVASPEFDMQVDCMQFWEDPIIQYDEVEICLEKGRELGEKISHNFKKNNLLITDFNVYCIPIDKTNG